MLQISELHCRWWISTFEWMSFDKMIGYFVKEMQFEKLWNIWEKKYILFVHQFWDFKLLFHSKFLILLYIFKLLFIWFDLHQCNEENQEVQSSQYHFLFEIVFKKFLSRAVLVDISPMAYVAYGLRPKLLFWSFKLKLNFFNICGDIIFCTSNNFWLL